MALALQTSLMPQGMCRRHCSARHVLFGTEASLNPYTCIIASLTCPLRFEADRGWVRSLAFPLLQMKLVDTASAQLCLQGKYVVLLGDSTMTDTMHDLVLLLSGLAARPEELEAYVYNATR